MTTRRIVNITPANTAGMKRVRTATNYAANPRAGTVTTNWTAAAGSSGMAGTLSRVVAAGPGGDATTFVRLTVTAAPVAAGFTVTEGTGGVNTVDASDIGKEFQTAFWVRCSRAGTQIRPGLGAFGSSGSLGSTYADTVTVTAANQWVAFNPAKRILDTGTTSIQNVLNFRDLTTQVGDTIDIVVALYKSEDLFGLTPIYRDGDSKGWAWAGTAHGSRSSGIVGIA